MIRRKINECLSENLMTNVTFEITSEVYSDSEEFTVVFAMGQYRATLLVTCTDTNTWVYHSYIGHCACSGSKYYRSIISVFRQMVNDIDDYKEMWEVVTGTTETTETAESKEIEEETEEPEGTEKIIAKIENINHCPNQNTCCIVSPFVNCNYNYKSDSCIKAHKNFIHYCEQVHKQMKAKSNPEWHHVSLATLANVDFDMLDEKHKLVRDINQILKDGIRNLYKCENHISFEVLERYVIRKCDELIRHNRLKAFWFSYIARQLDEVRRNTIYLYTPYITAHRNIW